MVNTNKILTVSYGTFSCTLEGFDDSFGTMKAIAEYFRDLAADDRYFGAEPPTPDAEMLARIAEREIARRVEAHFEENKIVLRADPGSALPVAAQVAAQQASDAPKAEAQPEDAPAPAHEPRETTEAEATPEQPAAMEDEPADEAAQVTAPAPSEEPEAEPVQAGEPQPDMAQAGMTAEAEMPQAQEEAAAAEAAEATDEGETAAQDIAEETPEDALEDALEDAALAEDEAGETAEDVPAPMAQPDPESVAAKLQRIRAVVSAAETGAAPVSGYSEDEHADDFLADAHEDIEAAMEIDDAAEHAAAADDDEDQHDADDDIAALLSRFDTHADDEGLFDEDQDEDAAFAMDAIADHDEGEAAVAPADTDDARADTAEAIAGIVAEDHHEDHDLAEELAEDMAQDMAWDHDADEQDEPAATAPAQLHARVIKMKRSDFEAAIAEGHAEEEAPADSSLSPEDEADLLRELAAVEAELGTGEAEDDAPDMDLAAYLADEDDEDDGTDTLERFEDAAFDDETDDADAGFDDEDDDDLARGERNVFADDEAETARPAPFAGSDAEAEMGRIFDETDQHLKDETGRGRRNAIAHLRAAVAANKAELGAGGDLAGEGPDSEAYRDDLASVVRPRRPQMRDESGRTRRPEASRPAPLKLVAEQRVDLDEAKPAPVRPRRVQVPAQPFADETAAAGDFAEYAESVGAASLPELLEAAAAYLSFVEGREQFSRPQLMTHVRQVEQDDFSREDGLRSFGQLLREGKIVKLKGGRFAASDSISYRPDARYAGE